MCSKKNCDEEGGGFRVHIRIGFWICEEGNDVLTTRTRVSETHRQLHLRPENVLKAISTGNFEAQSPFLTPIFGTEWKVRFFTIDKALRSTLCNYPFQTALFLTLSVNTNSNLPGVAVN